MTSQFQNYVPIQDLPTADGFVKAIETISESSQIIEPESVTENISESSVVTIT